MDWKKFEEYVQKAVEGLPDYFRKKMDNVEIVVENRPSPQLKKSIGMGNHDILLGLYQGTPITKRSSHYGLVLPDKISIYKSSIERVYKSEKDIIRGIRETIIHEIAHHFGISDDRLQEIENENRRQD